MGTEISRAFTSSSLRRTPAHPAATIVVEYAKVRTLAVRVGGLCCSHAQSLLSPQQHGSCTAITPNTAS